jgi:glycosyltransferase involved in cell wall biosynthesis
MKISKLSVVVPCFNEGGNLSRYRKELFGELEKSGLTCEYIFVDDGSSDNTYEGLKQLQIENKNVVVVRHAENKGLGAALRTGFVHSQGDAILTIDADLTFHPQEFPKLLEAYHEGVDCVLGSPLKGKMIGVSFHRKLTSHVANLLYQIVLKRPFTSASSIFRLYRSSTLRTLDLTLNSFDINAEILFKLIKKDSRIKEVPANLGIRMHGESKLSTSREIFNHLILLSRIALWQLRK